MQKTSNPTIRLDTRLSLIVDRRDSREKREQQDSPRDTSEQARNGRDVQSLITYIHRGSINLVYHGFLPVGVRHSINRLVLKDLKQAY